MSEDARPPYVVFELRAIEDRTVELETGRYGSKDVAYAIITPAGSKDRLEKEAELWLKDLEDAVRQERFPREWLSAYRGAFKDWSENQETPVDGISVRDWPGASPAQVKMLLDLNYRTVEDLAEATEEGVSRIGMGGRALKSKAQAFLDSSKDTGKVAAELEQLRKQVEGFVARDAEREAELTKLQAENAALSKASK